MKKLYCVGCGKYLGIIRDAKLRKNITHLCESCDRIFQLLKASKKSDYSDIFKDIFGGF